MVDYEGDFVIYIILLIYPYKLECYIGMWCITSNIATPYVGILIIITSIRFGHVHTYMINCDSAAQQIHHLSSFTVSIIIVP